MPRSARAKAGRSDPSRGGGGVRLQRILADAGVAARRACEELIERGHVTVNGRTVTRLPAFADPRADRIEVDGRPLPKPERHIYVMLNKPARVLSAAADEPGADRRTVVGLVQHPSGARLYPVGRLDYDSVGLVLLTNDGELANRLIHPRYGVPKTYLAVVRGQLEEEGVEKLAQGIYLAERKEGRTVGAVRTARVELRIHKRERDRTVLEVTLREGRNRQVRRMLAKVGYPVKSLERVAMGPLKLRGLARGQWRELERQEVQALRRAVRHQPGQAPDAVAGPPPAAPRAPREPRTPRAKGRAERRVRAGAGTRISGGPIRRRRTERRA